MSEAVHGRHHPLTLVLRYGQNTCQANASVVGQVQVAREVRRDICVRSLCDADIPMHRGLSLIRLS